MAEQDIAIIVNSFNRFSLLKEAIGALYEWIPTSRFNERIAIVVYDAGSTDGSVAWLEKKAAENVIPLKVIVPTGADDTSFSAGLNTAVAHAEQFFPFLSYLLFYETDNQILSAQPVTDALRQLTDQDKLAACGFTVRKHTGEEAGVGAPFPRLVNFALGKNIVHRYQLEAIPYRWKTDAEGTSFSDVDVVYTSPLLVKLNAWRESGGMDAQTFPFAECDVDWARRLRTLGWRMGVVQTDQVIHDNRDMLSGWSRTRALQFHRARLRYFFRYKPGLIVTVWPVALLVRHLLELTAVKLTIKETVHRKQLSEQFVGLLKRCLKKYEY